MSDSEKKEKPFDEFEGAENWSADQQPVEPMMKHFIFDHLPDYLAATSKIFFDAATSICSMVEPGPERTVALRKLLEAKDAVVRATVFPHS